MSENADKNIIRIYGQTAPSGRDIVFQLNILEQDGYLAAADIIKSLLNMSEADRLLLRARVEAAAGGDQNRINLLWMASRVMTGSIPGAPSYERDLKLLIDESEEKLDTNQMARQLDQFYGLKN